MNTFEITYKVTVLEGEQIDQKIEDICIEQSAELSRNLLDDHIQKEIIGKLVSKKQLQDQSYKVIISWPVVILGREITQFLNVLYGNISLKGGIRIIDVQMEKLVPDIFGGPEFGISGIRKRYAIPDRPLSATALKPMGKTSAELADLCYRFACGGIDIIKDDHGLTNQEFAPFEERISSCVSAIRKAKENASLRSYYFPNITASSAEVFHRCQKASDLGADGVLICPHISGLETMHRLARMNIDLPIIAHPAFSGQLTTHNTQGLSPEFLYGRLWRALGADFVIYPNKGGRFSFTTAQCKEINQAARNGKSALRRSLPMPGGGMSVETLGEWVTEYGNDTAFLIGGSLYEHPDGIQNRSRAFREQLRPK